jgi:hypothetical protein
MAVVHMMFSSYKNIIIVFLSFIHYWLIFMITDDAERTSNMTGQFPPFSWVLMVVYFCFIKSHLGIFFSIIIPSERIAHLDICFALIAFDSEGYSRATPSVMQDADLCGLIRKNVSTLRSLNGDFGGKSLVFHFVAAIYNEGPIHSSYQQFDLIWECWLSPLNWCACPRLTAENSTEKVLLKVKHYAKCLKCFLRLVPT